MSNVRGRLNRLEREATAMRSRTKPNVFDALLQLLLGNIKRDDVDPEDRAIVEQLYHAVIGGGPAAASTHSTQESTNVPR